MVVLRSVIRCAEGASLRVELERGAMLRLQDARVDCPLEVRGPGGRLELQDVVLGAAEALTLGPGVERETQGLSVRPAPP
jgi:hypothetical protein